MRTFFLAVIAGMFLTIAGLSHAEHSENGDNGEGHGGQGGQGGNGGNGGNGGSSNQGQFQGQFQSQGQGQDQSQSSRNRNTNRNENTNRNTNINANTGVNVQGQSVNNKQTIAPSQSIVMETPRQAVPAAGVSAAGTTATCRIAGGASVGAVWGGFSFSGSVVDENCVALEIAKAAIWAGSNTGDADLVQIGTHIIREQAKALVGPAKAKVEAAPMSSTPFSWEMDSSN